MSSNVLYFHNFLGREEAEKKLVADGIEKTYLARRSSLNEDYYILSYQSNGGKSKHEIVHSKPAYASRDDAVDLENVFAVLREMVETNSECVNAVFAISTETDGQGEARHLPCSQEVNETGHVPCPQEVGEAGHVHSHQDLGEAAHHPGEEAAPRSKKRNRKAKRNTPVILRLMKMLIGQQSDRISSSSDLSVTSVICHLTIKGNVMTI